MEYCVNHPDTKSVSGKIRCQYCLDINAKAARAKRARHKELGTCSSHPNRKAVRVGVCQECRDKKNADKKRRCQRRKEAGVCMYHPDRPAITQIYCQECNDNRRSRNFKIKKQVFNHYGNICRCCQRKYDLVFLCMDHINGDGNKHRREIGHNGFAIYRWIIKNEFPTFLQTLCWNCNEAKRIMGSCPCNGFLNT